MEHLNIPKYWKLVKFGDICYPAQYGWTTSAANSGSIRFLRTTDISNKLVINWDTVPYAEQTPPNISKFLLRKGDILISRTGAGVGLSFLIDEVSGDTIFASYLIRFTPILVNPKYIYYFTQTQSYWNQLKQGITGNAVTNVNANSLAKIILPLTSLREQTRIIQNLEERLKEIEDKLRDNQSKLKDLAEYRQSVLEEVTTNTLLNKEYIVNDISTFVGSGVTPTGGQYNYLSAGIPFIRSQNVLANNLDLTNVAYISLELHEKMLRTQVQEHDILLNITGASIGRAAVVPKGFEEGNVNQHVCIIRVDKEKINPYFLCLFLNSQRGQAVINSYQNGGNREGLNYSQIKKISFKAASLDIQTGIVNIIQEKLTQITSLEQFYLAEIEKSSNLRQSILQQAFEGNLSEAQVGDDEVEELLRNIKVEKELYEVMMKSKSNDTQKKREMTSTELKAELKHKLFAIYNTNQRYTVNELNTVVKNFIAEYSSAQNSNKLDFEDVANIFDELVRESVAPGSQPEVRMIFEEGEIYYQNNFS